MIHKYVVLNTSYKILSNKSVMKSREGGREIDNREVNSYKVNKKWKLETKSTSRLAEIKTYQMYRPVY